MSVHSPLVGSSELAPLHSKATATVAATHIPTLTPDEAACGSSTVSEFNRDQAHSDGVEKTTSHDAENKQGVAAETEAEAVAAPKPIAELKLTEALEEA